MNLASAYLQVGQTGRARPIFDQVLASSNVPANAVVFIATACRDLQDLPGMERALERLTQIMPESVEAWSDLAALKAHLATADKRKVPEGIQALRRALELNAKRAPAAASNLYFLATNDARFNPLKSDPEFQKVVAPK